MAAIEVTITGILYDKLARTVQQVVLIGEASYTGLGVGGGPVIPPGQPPSDAHPEHPIVYPPGIWGPTDPRPTPPIYLPPSITPPEPPSSGTKPPPDGEAGWGFYDGRWGYFPGPADAQPK